MRYSKVIIATLFLSIVSLVSCSRQDGKVKVEGGWIQGTVTDEGMSVYKGIPFAAPPVGELRWKAPQAVIPWKGVRDANDYAPGPMQGGDDPYGYSEDCLYLNVWSPAKSSREKLPVLVWFYGGGFAGGRTADPVTDGTDLAGNGIILVTTAYRVGKLGFLAHPGLSAENPEGVSGNYGLLDQIEALKWIQKNISAFGGDPDKVTIFGESAGGISVSMLCASPLAKGLFRGAISESGGSFGPVSQKSSPGENMVSLKTAEQDGLRIAESLGAESVEELRALPAEKFVERGLAAGGGWPNVDGYVIPDDQYRMYEKGNFNDVNIMVGYNSDEGASFSWARDAESHIAGVNDRFGPYADALLKAYPVSGNSVPKSARDLYRDAAFGWHTWSWARLQKEKGSSKVFLYYFDQHPDYPEDSPRHGYGSPHGQEVRYVFQHLEEGNIQPTDEALMKTMGQYWVNFTKYGDPNGTGVPAWPEFDNANPQAMYLTGPTPFPGPVPDEEALWTLNEYFRWRRDPFWEGADISFARGQEARGFEYKNAEGEARECTALMKELGLNAISIRVWVNPKPFGRHGEQQLSPEDPQYHVGLCDKEDVLAKALAAKEQGMEILLSFHYSDSWSDPKSQPIPEAWMGHDYETMKQDVRNHTVEVLQLLKDNGVTPKWAKLGNETANGILWNGKIGQEDMDNCMGHLKYNPEQYAGFISAGHEAAKSVFPDIITLCHVDSGFDSELYDRNVGTLVKYGAKFDQVGMSIYPYWAATEHGMNDADQVLDLCIKNIKHVYEKFGKDCLIVETGFLDTEDPAVLAEGHRLLYKLLEDAKHKTDGHCKGVFYWEPESGPGGYQLGAFDREGKPTEIMDAFIESE